MSIPLDEWNRDDDPPRGDDGADGKPAQNAAYTLRTRFDYGAVTKQVAALGARMKRGTEAPDEVEKTLRDLLKRVAPAPAAEGLAALVSSAQPCGESWLYEEPPRQEYLLRWKDPTVAEPRPWLPSGIVGILASPGGYGKTTALVQLACCVTSSVPWLGCIETPHAGRVLCILAEETPETARRLVWRATREWPTHAQQQVAQRLVCIGAAGLDCQLTNGEGGATPALDALRERLETPGEPWRLVVLDTLSRHAGWRDENDNAGAAAVMRAISSLSQTRNRPAVLVAHHTGKWSDGTTQDSIRGAGAIVAEARWAAIMARLQTPDGDCEARRLAVVKSNYTRCSSLVLRLDEKDGGIVPRLEKEDERAKREAAAAKAAKAAKKPAGDNGKPTDNGEHPGLR